MTKVKANTQKGQSIIRDLQYNRNVTDIYDAYGRPSAEKVRTFRDIERRAENTEGYNGDLHITGAGSSFYSTIYSYTVDGITTIVKDTYANTYCVILA